MVNLGVDFDIVSRLARREDMTAVSELKAFGFSDTSVLNLTGYVTRRGVFTKAYLLSKKWMPMLLCPVDLTEQCCVKLKEEPMNALSGSFMTGEQASESANRERQYLKTGCNAKLANGFYKSKPFGAMTQEAVLYSLNFRQTPIAADYGCIVCNNGQWACTGCKRTGCALCGFGCQYDTERFLRLQDTEPQKLRFAFNSKENGGLGYREAIEFMNEYCGTNVLLPEL